MNKLFEGLSLDELRSLSYDLEELIEELDYNSLESVESRERQRKHQEEHPELYGVFNSRLFSEKIQKQFRKKLELERVLDGH